MVCRDVHASNILLLHKQWFLRNERDFLTDFQAFDKSDANVRHARFDASVEQGTDSDSC